MQQEDVLTHKIPLPTFQSSLHNDNFVKTIQRFISRNTMP